MLQSEPHSESVAMLGFFVIVNIVHEIAHAARKNVIDTLTVRIDPGEPFFHRECTFLSIGEHHPEAGSLVEQALMGGQSE